MSACIRTPGALTATWTSGSKHLDLLRAQLKIQRLLVTRRREEDVRPSDLVPPSFVCAQRDRAGLRVGVRWPTRTGRGGGRRAGQLTHSPSSPDLKAGFRPRRSGVAAPDLPARPSGVDGPLPLTQSFPGPSSLQSALPPVSDRIPDDGVPVGRREARRGARGGAGRRRRRRRGRLRRDASSSLRGREEMLGVVEVEKARGLELSGDRRRPRDLLGAWSLPPSPSPPFLSLSAPSPRQVRAAQPLLTQVRSKPGKETRPVLASSSGPDARCLRGSERKEMELLPGKQET